MTLTQQSYYRQEKSYQVTSVATSYGQRDPVAVAVVNGSPPTDGAAEKTVDGEVQNALLGTPAGGGVLSSELASTSQQSPLPLHAVSYFLAFLYRLCLVFRCIHDCFQIF